MISDNVIRRQKCKPNVLGKGWNFKCFNAFSLHLHIDFILSFNYSVSQPVYKTCQSLCVIPLVYAFKVILSTLLNPISQDRKIRNKEKVEFYTHIKWRH